MEPLTPDDPRQVGGFRLQSRLGAGGMGRVYLGSSPGGRPVAVKIVHPELAGDPDFMRRFRREVQAAEAVSGAYTAPVVGAGPDDSPPWLATAYVAGPSLAELVRGAGPLPEAAVWRLAGGLIEALQAIHARGLIHRDLKPGNILIAADGPRVIDFGISRALHGTALTDTRTTMGTPAYMSPEQAEGAEVGPPSDVFSLGSVLAYAATGTAPFDGGEALSVIYRIVHAEPDLGRLPPALIRLVAGCLAKNAASRPSLDALLGAVAAGSAAFPGNVPGKFWPDSVAGLLAGRAAPVHPETVGVTHPRGTTAPSGQPTPARPPAADTMPGRRLSRRWLLVTATAGVAAAAVGATLALTLGSGPTGSGPAGPGLGLRPTGATGTAGQTANAAAAASRPATSPAAVSHPASPASSSTSSLIAVTVCEFPSDGCNLPSSTQYMQVRPKRITDSGDGSGQLINLVWSHWGDPRATATGTQEINNCDPNCAQGTLASYPATVTVTGLTPYGAGLEAYATIVIQSSAPDGTATYSINTVPQGG